MWTRNCRRRRYSSVNVMQSFNRVRWGVCSATAIRDEVVPALYSQPARMCRQVPSRGARFSPAVSMFFLHNHTTDTAGSMTSMCGKRQVLLYSSLRGARLRWTLCTLLTRDGAALACRTAFPTQHHCTRCQCSRGRRHEPRFRFRLFLRRVRRLASV